MGASGGSRLRVRASTFTLALLLLLPAGFAAPLPQDDAASGQDAPGTATPLVEVRPGTVYTGTLAPGVDAVDFFWFTASPGQRIDVAIVGSAVCIASIHDANGRLLSSGCTLPLPGPEAVSTATATASGVHYIRVNTFATAYRFSFSLDGSPPDPLGAAPGSPSPGTDPTCRTGAPVTKTQGERDGVVYAALKTGFRAVVAWTSDAPEIGSVTFGIDGGATVTVSDAGPRLNHVFILDGLPATRTLCFATSTGVSDAIALRNAMQALDGGVYTVNLLLTAPLNQRARDVMEPGVDLFAERLFDSTDGRVQAGRVLILYMDPERANSGTYTCFVAGAPGPTCDRRVDATFSYDSCAGGAACATLDGIQRPGDFMMMNSVYDANPVTSDLVRGVTEVGAVLLHEFGHYAFGMMDLYVAGDCYDASLSLSVMGGSRSVTEFDDNVHRCPNEAQLGPDYVPSWNYLRARFPAIPDRAGPILEGPHGGGSAYARHVYAFTPTVDEDVDPQDDAGSGGDAPAGNAGAPVLQPGVLYDANFVGAESDVFRFDAPAGAAIEAVVYGSATCFALLPPSGPGIPQSCSTSVEEGVRVRATAPGGPVYLRVTLGALPAYKLGVGLDAPAPAFEL